VQRKLKVSRSAFFTTILIRNILGIQILHTSSSTGAKFTFSVYDVDEKNQIDATLLGPALRALGLTPSLALISELGGTTRSGMIKTHLEL
jgi:hypothetical protein